MKPAQNEHTHQILSPLARDRREGAEATELTLTLGDAEGVTEGKKEEGVIPLTSSCPLTQEKCDASGNPVS